MQRINQYKTAVPSDHGSQCLFIAPLHKHRYNPFTLTTHNHVSIPSLSDNTFQKPINNSIPPEPIMRQFHSSYLIRKPEIQKAEWKIRGLGETLAKQLQKAANRRREKRRRICVQKVRGISRKVLSEVEKERSVEVRGDGFRIGEGEGYASERERK
ncbi:hypothetical protein VNO80_21564 [Phaseolus coccineus]|uniref:Uncharacterized protein n=1 Tax=Phaseolus coccineus TaxID=3886 RepID=A0AAN9M3H8_PHACN